MNALVNTAQQSIVMNLKTGHQLTDILLQVVVATLVGYILSYIPSLKTMIVAFFAKRVYNFERKITGKIETSAVTSVYNDRILMSTNSYISAISWFITNRNDPCSNFVLKIVCYTTNAGEKNVPVIIQGSKLELVQDVFCDFTTETVKSKETTNDPERITINCVVYSHVFNTQ